ncbi:glycoside hydrolase family 92 protein, partial [Streptomyces sp. MCAF7]
MPSRPPAALAAVALTAGLLASALTATPAAAQTTTATAELVKDPAAYVDPLIGSRNGGNTYPGAVVPFGMLSWSPENTRGNATRTAAPGGYQYDATRIRGFSLTHMSGTGCAGGSGDIPFFPFPGEVTSSPA